jgi:hypothetical protein
VLGYIAQDSVNFLLLAIAVATTLLKLWAFVDCLLRRADAFVAAGKLTKLIWLGITGVSALIAAVDPNPIDLLNVVGIVASIVYLVDVRPAVRQVGGGFGGRFGRGGGGPSGW